MKNSEPKCQIIEMSQCKEQRKNNEEQSLKAVKLYQMYHVLYKISCIRKGDFNKEKQ